ncbi:hypothetical protein [Nonomuraea sp. NPDC049480]|uniref:hypothetical protein n=1 Tax=Nonomuraea sp. NPDC049480 TaxID=3364353 RepID=UPI0037937CC0
MRGIGELDADGSRVQRCWTEPVLSALSALTDAQAAEDVGHAVGVEVRRGRSLIAA